MKCDICTADVRNVLGMANDEEWSKLEMSNSEQEVQVKGGFRGLKAV